jgi:hypothetical protein
MSCRKCWAPQAHPVELAKGGEVFAIADICDGCFDRALAGYDVMRAQFDELIAAGVPRDMANDIMCARIQGEASS